MRLLLLGFCSIMVLKSIKVKRTEGCKKTNGEVIMKKTVLLIMSIAIMLGLLTACSGEQIQLDYHESFVVQAYNEINGKIGYSKGYSLQDAKYAYISEEHLAMEESVFDDCTSLQRDFFNDIYCVIELTVLMDGEQKQFTKYFSISSYDLTGELEGRRCLEALLERITLTRMDLTRLTKFIS